MRTYVLVICGLVAVSLLLPATREASAGWADGPWIGNEDPGIYLPDLDKPLREIRKQLDERIDLLAERQDEFFTQVEAEQLVQKLSAFAQKLEELSQDNAELKDTVAGLKTKLDDLSGAYDTASAILVANPNHTKAQAALARSAEVLEGMHASKLGDTRAVPKVKVAPTEVIWLDLDHRAGFVLAQVDGVSSYEDIIEVTGMNRLQSLKILAQLVQKGIIGPK